MSDVTLELTNEEASMLQRVLSCAVEWERTPYMEGIFAALDSAGVHSAPCRMVFNKTTEMMHAAPRCCHACSQEIKS